MHFQRNQKNILKRSRPQTKQKSWNSKYKRQYRMKQRTKPNYNEMLINQRQKNTIYKHRYRARKNANANVRQTQSTCENESWWDILCALGETAL
ncbi:hypothetical protein F8M41_019249 [Gigaspora margarita]|uniref:Uncharacterized protein n=1 Tax=Gigaspora margarita TaxID=4874 RepID=A0A8H4EKS8_GIGMA|nr:hypothetical protein F8M41_019249 [Gigaspora margarita]